MNEEEESLLERLASVLAELRRDHPRQIRRQARRLIDRFLQDESWKDSPEFQQMDHLDVAIASHNATRLHEFVEKSPFESVRNRAARALYEIGGVVPLSNPVAGQGHSVLAGEARAVR